MGHVLQSEFQLQPQPSSTNQLSRSCGVSSHSTYVNMNSCPESIILPQYGFQFPTTSSFTFANGNKEDETMTASTSHKNKKEIYAHPLCMSEDADPSYDLTNFHILNGASDPLPQNSRNVHFSPVVSQLRYVPAKPRRSSAEPPPEKVKVQVQRIEPPLHQHVERIQVCIPPAEVTNYDTQRLVLDLNEVTKHLTPLRPKDNNELFLNSFTQKVQPVQQNWNGTEDSLSKLYTEKENLGQGLENNVRQMSRFKNNMTGLVQGTDVERKDDFSGTQVKKQAHSGKCAIPVPPDRFQTHSHFQEDAQNHLQNESSTIRTTNCRLENAFPSTNYAGSGSTTAGYNPRQRQALKNLGSLESLDGGCGEGASANTEELELAEAGTSDSDNKKCNNKSSRSKGHSWPSAYRRFIKEKSKPKLSFLQRITFGRFGNNEGGGSSGETAKTRKDDPQNPKGSKKSQKRSSCPPLGHPLLNSTDRDIDISKIGLEDCVDSGESAGLPRVEKSNGEYFLSEIRQRPVATASALLTSKEFKAPEPISNGNPFDLPPRPVPRQRKLSQASNSSGYSSITRRTQNDPFDPDELSLTFERIMEGITDLDADINNKSEGGSFSSSSIASQVACGNGNENVFVGEPETGTLCQGFDNDNGKVSLLVKGKPPIPPSSASRLSGMRTAGVSERLSFLRGRLSGTATTETRLAIELAAKLSLFREELHRSREEIASSRPNLDEIESSVRISMAIDRCERTLPHTRNLTTLSPPILPAIHSTSGTSHQDEPVKRLTEAIKEEWESVLSRAKRSFSRSPPSKNGRSADPCEGLVLETDLDSGTSLGFPVGHFGDGVPVPRQVLKVEDPACTPGTFVPRNSCSLQNLTCCGVNNYLETMATLKPGDPGGGNGKEDRSRSMEFLLDDNDKNAHLRPPENKLMKNQETSRRPSEHELRVQRSLQKLNVPDWYKNYSASGTASAAGTPSKSRDFGCGSGLAGGWPGLSSSKTSSLTSLQSAGRYAGSKSGFGYGRHRPTGGSASAGGRSSRDSLMSPSSTASASPSPNFERSSFTYGMPYALTRFATTRMSCGASPASLSPSPSPVGGIGTSTSTPVSSGPAARYGYQKQPYLGWRSQERLASKSLYRSPAERLAADLIAQKVKPPPVTPIVVEQPPPPEIEIRTSPKKEIASSDLSLNNSEESNSHKLNRVRSSIKEVSNAIVDYVNETKPLDDGMNGRASPRRGLVWLESSFVGTKPIDSPGTPDTPSTFMSHRGSRKDTTAFRFDDTSTADRTKDGEVKSAESSSTSHYASYVSRNEQMEERSNSSSVSSPTLEDILDSLLALRRPNKKFRSRGKGHEPSPKPEDELQYPKATASTITTTTTSSTSATTPPTAQQSRQQPPSSYHQYDYEPSTTSEIYSTAITSSTKSRCYPEPSPTPPTSASEWQERFNQAVADSTFNFGEPETFAVTKRSGALHTSSNSSSNNNYSSYDKTQVVDRYSASVGVTHNDSVCSSSSSANLIHSASSSIHSTPTHQQYKPHNQSQAIASSSAASKEYYCSSTSSSPAKSCLVDTTQQHRDENELRQSLRFAPSTTAPADDDDELAFGNPTEIRSAVTTTSSVAPLTGGVIVNPLTGLSEYSNPPTPARHRRVSFDLDFSDKEEKSSSRSRNKDENVGGTIQCRNTKCGKTATGLEARREFKVCHNCNAYYCCRECRRAHWEKHKKTCMQSRVGAICKQIISHVKEDSYVMNQLSTVAKRGFLAKGRGCVKLFFNSADRAERFLSGGLPELPEPLYIPHSDMLPEEMGAQTFSELSDQCRSYNPETRFVLYACVCVVNEVPTYGAVKWERELISRSSKLRLLLPRNFYEETQRLHHPPANPVHLMSALQDPSSGRTSPAAPGMQQGQQPQPPHVPLYDSVSPAVPPGEDLPPPLPPHQNTVTTTTSADNDTLILRSVPPPSSHQLSSSEHKRLREVSFTNIQKHLLLRGVDLKKTYPDIFSKLCRYVEHDEPFLPVTIYPRNNDTGRQFVCVIMPESSDSAYSAATEESVQKRPLQRVETINISEPDDDDDVMDLT